MLLHVRCFPFHAFTLCLMRLTLSSSCPSWLKNPEHMTAHLHNIHHPNHATLEARTLTTASFASRFFYFSLGLRAFASKTLSLYFKTSALGFPKLSNEVKLTNSEVPLSIVKRHGEGDLGGEVCVYYLCPSASKPQHSALFVKKHKQSPLLSPV